MRREPMSVREAIWTAWFMLWTAASAGLFLGASWGATDTSEAPWWVRPLAFGIAALFTLGADALRRDFKRGVTP